MVSSSSRARKEDMRFICVLRDPDLQVSVHKNKIVVAYF